MFQFRKVQLILIRALAVDQFLQFQFRKVQLIQHVSYNSFSHFVFQFRKVQLILREKEKESEALNCFNSARSN